MARTPLPRTGLPGRQTGPLHTYELLGVTVRSRLPYGTARKAAALYLAGDEVLGICAACRVHYSALAKLVTRLGIKRTKSHAARLRRSREQGRDLDALQAEALRLYFEERESGTRVAALLDLDDQTVYSMIRRSGRRPRTVRRAMRLAVEEGRYVSPTAARSAARLAA